MVKPVLKRTLKNGEKVYTLRVANGRLKSGKTKYSKRDVRVSNDLSSTKVKKFLEEETFKFENEIKNSQTTNKNVFFKQFAENWLYIKKQSGLAPSTYTDYSNTVIRLNNEFGQYKIVEITDLMVVRFYEKLRSKGANKNNTNKCLSEKTIKNIHDVLCSILDCAVDDEIIIKNPLHKKNFPTPKPIKKDIVFLDENDLRCLAQDLSKEKLKYQCMVRIALDTGLRIGEINALEWKDINFKTGLIKITKTIQRIPKIGLIEKPPKTKNSIRVVYIGQDVIELLKQHKQEQNDLKSIMGDLWNYKIELKDAKGNTFIKDNDKIFTQENGLPINPSTCHHWLKKFTSRNNLKDYTPHSFRHTFATLSLEEKQPINAISKTLGHSNISTTSNIYIKTTDKSKEVLSTVMTNKMSDIFNNQKK